MKYKVLVFVLMFMIPGVASQLSWTSPGGISSTSYTDDQARYAVNNTWGFTFPSVLVLGDVGIGTSSPQRPLHVSSNGDAFIRLQDTEVGGQTAELFAGTGGVGFGTDTTPQQFVMLSSAPTNSIVAGATSTDFLYDINARDHIVKGAIKIYNAGFSDVELISYGINGIDYQMLYGAGNHTFWNPMDIKASVRISGMLKIPAVLWSDDQVSACTTANEGQVIYNASSHVHLGCNSTEWRRLY